MKSFLNRIIRNKQINEIHINKDEIIKFHNQLVKMSLKRPHIKSIVILKKCYPLFKEQLTEIIKEYECSTAN